MTEALLNMLPSAIGVAISPIPIAAILLMLISKRARTNAVTFLVGWSLSLFILGFIIVSIGGATNVQSGKPGQVAHWVALVVGVLLLVLAVNAWHNRPPAGEPVPDPKWLASLEMMRGGAAFGKAALLAAISPKNFLLTLAGVLSIAQAGVNDSEIMALLIVFVIIASLGIAAPIAYYWFAGRAAVKPMQRLKARLVRHNAITLATILGLLGLKITLVAGFGLW